MNNPGLDGPIAQADREVHNEHEKDNDETSDEDSEEEEEQNYLVPTRWWYASTACPLLAGTFGPMANAFSICALVENWRSEIPPGGSSAHGIDVPDPNWLIAINGVSLACALIANLSLLLNMARRLPFAIAQPITIIGFWLASILLIALIAVANTSHFRLPDNRDRALTGAYYYGIFAAGLYQFISYLMCATVYGAYTGHYSKEFHLTVAQRTLMLQTISFLVWQHLWALVYSHVEGWEYLDAVYWADFTSLTVGIGGSYVPETHLGRSLLFLFALGGIVILGLVVGSIRSLVLDRGKEKIEARMTEKTRQRLVKRVAAAMERDDKLPKRQFDWLHIHHLPRTVRRALTLQPGSEIMSEKDRRYYEFEAMRRIQHLASSRRRYYSLCVSIFAFAFLWLMGAFVFYKSEVNQDWSYFASLYFAYTSLLTIGYGDYEPMSPAGKAFFVFWSLLAIPTLTILISNMGDTVVKGVKDATIWIGEITVLPSNEATVLERLRYGLLKSLFGKRVARTKHEQRRNERQQKQQDPEDGPHVEEPPGRILGTKFLRRRHKHREAVDASDRLAANFEKSEKEDERLAQLQGNKTAEMEHHRRRILLEEIRKVYRDVSAPEEKQYSYEEWAFYIKLLGQDENDSKYHLQPHTEDDAPGSHSDHTKHRQSHDSPERERYEIPKTGPIDEQRVVWSWIGQKSPLMDPKSEPEWLLDKLFRKLEGSLSKTLPVTSECAVPQQRPADSEKTILERHPTPQRRPSGRSPSSSNPSTAWSGGDGERDDFVDSEKV